MQEAELLFTIAEVSVAFAGFASIVSVLGRGHSRDDPSLDSFRLRTMLSASLGVVAFSLFPILPAKFGAPDALVWRISALVALVAAGIFAPEWWLRYRELGRQGVRESRFIVYPLVVLELGVAVAFLLVAVGWFPQLSFPIYLAGLFLGLLVAGLYFFRVVTSVLVVKE